MGDQGNRTMFVISHQSGVPISHLSLFPDEKEVLLPFGIRLTVQGSANGGPGLRVITLKENSCEGLKIARNMITGNTSDGSTLPNHHRCLFPSIVIAVLVFFVAFGVVLPQWGGKDSSFAPFTKTAESSTLTPTPETQTPILETKTPIPETKTPVLRLKLQSLKPRLQLLSCLVVFMCLRKLSTISSIPMS